MESKTDSHLSAGNHAGGCKVRSWLYAMAIVAALILAIPGMGLAINIDDEPIESRPKPAAPMVMFVLDDSGSMDWEFMTPEDSGTFMWNFYLFPANSYSPYTDHQYWDSNTLDSGDRNIWKSQWFGYNKIYYNPYSDYEPWVSTSTYSFSDQNLDNPRSNPISSQCTIDMTYKFYSVDALVDQVVVDDQDSAFSKSSNGWASYNHPDAYNGQYFFTNNNDGTAWARWTPSLPAAGKYVVQVRWRALSNRYKKVTYKVVHDGTTEAAVPSEGVNQRKNSGQWVTIGTWYFDAGGNEYVQLDATQTGDSKYCADAVRFIPESAANYLTVKILNAHYFTFYDADADGELDNNENVYLITWQDSDNNGHLDFSDDLNNDKRLYFRVMDQDADGRIEDNDLVKLDPVKDKTEIDRIRPGIYDDDGNFVRFKTDKEDLQNFVNWVSYYRRREFVAKAVVAKTINDLAGIQVGFYSLNNNAPRMTVKPVKVRMPGQSTEEDKTETLLDNLYDYRSDSGTPLRHALANVGKYYDDTDSSSGGLGSAPWWSASDGGECQKAFAIVITDGWWNGGLNGYGNVDGNEDAPYADTASNTLADVAMYYWKNDLSSTLDNQSTDRGCDRNNPKQHMVTYTIAFGVNGTIDTEDIDGDGTPDSPSYKDDPCFFNPNTPRPDWPTPAADTAKTVDDLWHASINGRGLYFSAQSPQELIDAMKAVFEDIGKPASASAVGLNSQQLNEKSRVYIARFIPEQWTGDLFAYPIDQFSGEVLTDSAHLLWSAADNLQDISVTADSRFIVTYNGSTGIPFRESYLTGEQKNLLSVNLPGGKTLADLITFLRGDEVPGFRQREKRLGDIVHSGPVLHDGIVYVGANDGMLHAFDAETGEEKFAYIPNIVIKNLRLLADVNYGVNHRFYVDGSQFVSTIVDQNNKWQTFLVGSLGKGGKGYYCLNLRTRLRNNANLVVESSISAAASEADVAGRVAWEYPRAGMPLLTNNQDDDGDGVVDELDEADPDLGYSYSKAYTVKAKAPNGGFRNVLIFGNGYNSYNGHAVLYIMDVESGAVLRKIDTGAGADNGLSTPVVVDVNADNLVDYAYAGDLKGNLWKFDLTDEDIDKWGVAYGVDSNKNGVIDATDGDSPAPLFSTGGQPITCRPDVIKMAIPQDETMKRFIYDMPGYMVIFGTGRLLSLQDREDISQQTIYGIWDYGEDSDDLEYVGQLTDHSTGALSITNLYLYKHTLVDQQIAAGDEWRTLTTMDDEDYWKLVEDNIDSDGHNNNTGFKFDKDDPRKKNPYKYAGWFFDIPVPPDLNAYEGERVIQDVQILNGSAHVVSSWPNDDPCSGGNGSYYYIFKAFSGGRFEDIAQFTKTGLVFIINNPDGTTTTILDKVNIGDNTNIALAPPTARKYDGGLNALNVINGHTYVGDTGGNPRHIATKKFRMGMFYWREW